ncbi:exopolyphosphatase [Lactobacillus selangorensis]|uniref:Exopolyphosphatase n=2 Tax=Lactobacillus selangorensis TaxID=81857 RepID=A0A0R2FH35_9LACO|nr:exopolyphosphatase [Lactobacillus selangorensis]KRN30600.1 exopolyphosphatase [Lactobacillus selangorensis]
MENFAVINLGSNSARLTINQIDDDGAYKEVGRYREFVRLSEDMQLHDNTLQPAAMDRTIEALKGFKTDYSKLSNVKLRAVATAAVRNAKNKKKFLKRVRDEIGIELEVIPGTQEAYYDYLGVTETLPLMNCLIMDTGGASTELILVQNRKANNLISIPMGSVNLTEKYLNPDQISARELFNMTTGMTQLYNGIWWLRKAMNLPIVALGGSNRTLAKIQRRKEHFQHFEDIHGYRMRNDEVNNVFGEVVSQNLDGRKKIPGLSKDRADIIVGGLIPIVTIISYLDSDRTVFSQNGLGEGILFEELKQLREEGKIK